MMRSEWGRRTFSMAVQHPEHVPAAYRRKMRRYEENHLRAKILVGNDKETRKARATATANVNNFVSDLSSVIRTSLFLEKTGGTCYLCGEALSPTEANWDHVFPRALCREVLGKVVTNGNTMPAHPACNHAKGTTPPTMEQAREAQRVHRESGIRFFDQDPQAYHRYGNKEHDWSHPLWGHVTKEGSV